MSLGSSEFPDLPINETGTAKQIGGVGAHLEAWKLGHMLRDAANLQSVRGRSEDVDVSVGAHDSAQPLLWGVDDDRGLKKRERQLLDAVAAGELDPHLVAIGDAIHARRELLRTVAAATALAELCVGDDVMFNHMVRSRYLNYEAATVVEVDDRSVTVRLWRPVGRFRDGLVRCPPLALHKLQGAPP